MTKRFDVPQLRGLKEVARIHGKVARPHEPSRDFVLAPQPWTRPTGKYAAKIVDTLKAPMATVRANGLLLSEKSVGPRRVAS